MSTVANFTFNPFQENTYILYDETKECIVIDPGCYTQAERDELINFIEANNLKPVRLINTHCHIDHVLGNKFIADKYDLELEIHSGEIPVLDALEQVSKTYGIPVELSPDASKFIEEGDEVKFGNTTLKTLLTPGHPPASISFFCEADRYVIAGDVLFYGSIGRTDLPGGNFDTLIRSIREQLFPLGDDVRVYCGHGPATSIGYEKDTNPFLNRGA